MKGFGISLLLFALGIAPALHKIHAGNTATSVSTFEKKELEITYPIGEEGATGGASAASMDMDIQSIRQQVLRKTGGLKSIRSIQMHNSISSDLVSISVESKTFQTMKVEIFDFSGKRILEWDETLNDGPNKITFNKKYIASGIYFIQASTKEGNLVRKFLN